MPLSALLGRVNELLAGLVWGAPMLAVFLFAGALLTLRTSAFQFRRFGFWLRSTFGSLFKKEGAGQNRDAHTITQRQALTSALAACLGTGNIVGVATALRLGGAGAIFWMWVSAALGMMTCCAENILSIRYRWRTASGSWMGGPMAYLQKGLGSKALAGSYAALLSLASFGIGNMTQANAIVQAARESFSLAPPAVGLALSALVGLVIFGGLRRIARVTEFVVPFMTGLFLLAGLAVIAVNAGALPGALGSIFREAFRLRAGVGGAAGYGIGKALRYGVARGVFSNEAGLGSSAVIHAAADVERPATQGLWGIAEVFLDTIVMCTVTALAMLCSGAWRPGGGPEGVALAAQSFASVFGLWGERFTALSIALFAFATLTGWSFYGEQGARYLLGEKSVKYYRGLYVAAVLLGSLLRLETVWSVSDTLNGLMAIPNLVGVVLLSGQAARELKAAEA
ncbi:MAG: sodium:alanine symporter family protein [Oscillospiraceae bacterium]|nr:sodium:alanine symporter family protein [Oscillospiraceae bacterium]